MNRCNLDAEAAACAASVIIIAQNEDKRIRAAIESCTSFADEIIVIDGGSTDQTVALCKQLGCRVYTNPWPGFAEQRQLGLARAKGEWVFFIDADEVVDQQLASAIGRVVREATSDKASCNAFEVERVGDFMGKWMSREYLLRLCRRNVATISHVLVHERLSPNSRDVGRLPGVLWHYGFRSVSDHVRRFNAYTNLEAEQAEAGRKKFRLTRLVLRPPARFLQRYVGQGLFRRGVPGFAVALLWSYYELMRELKLYELAWRRNGEPVENPILRHRV